MKHPYRLLLALSLCFSLQALAGGIRFLKVKSWEEVLAAAKKQNKLVFLDAYASWCGPCKYLEQRIFTNNAVGRFYNDHFVNVRLDMEAGIGPALAEKYGVDAYPTLFFINGEGEVVHKTVGVPEAEELIAMGKEALDGSRFEVVKNEARAGKISPAALNQWIEQAASREDEDVPAVIEQYFANTSYPLVEAGMLRLILDHARQLSQEQVDQIYREREKAADLLGLSPEIFDERFSRFVLVLAKAAAGAGGEPDFNKFKSVVANYYPDRAVMLTQRSKLAYHLVKEEDDKALEVLLGIFDAPQDFSVKVMAESVVDASQLIVARGRSEELIQKTEAWPLKESDSATVYYKDIALFSLYFGIGDKEKASLYAGRILQNPAVTPGLKQFISNLNEQRP